MALDLDGVAVSDLHDRIAKTLGWSTRDVQSLSMQSLRDLVRPIDPDLAREMDLVIQSGAYIIGEPTKPSPKRTSRKTKAQRERELEKSQRWLVMFQMPGSQWAYVARTGSGSAMSPDAAHDFGSRDAAEAQANALQGPRSSLRAKVTSRPKV